MSEPFDAVDLIRTKRDRGTFSAAEIDWLVDAYTRGAVADEQMSALAMAILLNGMEFAEIARWTQAMIASGERLDSSSLSRPTSDKHSTGGVGDKITLPLAPLVAACGVAVPQLSGRGLGHTGGTLDKLESIPQWRAALSNDEMMRQLEDVGAVVTQPAKGDYKVFSTYCPHAGGQVTRIEEGTGRPVCLLHGSVFDASTGAVVAGPSPRGLTPIPVATGGATS